MSELEPLFETFQNANEQELFEKLAGIALGNKTELLETLFARGFDASAWPATDHLHHGQLVRWQKDVKVALQSSVSRWPLAAGDGARTRYTGIPSTRAVELSITAA